MLMEFSVMPVGKNKSVADEIAQLVPLIEESGLDYRVNAMSTLVEGDWDALCALAKRCHARTRERNERVITTLRFDDEAGQAGELQGNVRAVEQALGSSVKS